MNKPIEIVYVQLGSAKAEHLIKNIGLAHKLFPRILINCVVYNNSDVHKSLPRYVNAIKFKPSEPVENMLQSKSIDLEFRQGFWRYSFERLLALHKAHSDRPLSSLLHVESDVLIMPSFPLSDFLRIQNVCWLPCDLSKDSASLMYFPNLKKSQEFNTDLNNLFVKSKQINDMKALYELRKQFPKKYRLLPTSNSNFTQLSNLAIDSAAKSFRHFDGVFDPAPIGMWLTGIDPRNNFGVTNYFASKKLSLLGMIQSPYAYPLYFVNNKSLIFKNGSKVLPVYKLHIHSKSSKIFSNSWKSEIRRLAKLSLKNQPYHEFSIRILIELLASNYSKKSLTQYLYNSPFIINIRKTRFLRRIFRKPLL